MRRKLPQPASLQLCDSRKRAANLPPTGMRLSDGVPAQPGQLAPVWRIKELFGSQGLLLRRRKGLVLFGKSCDEFAWKA